MFYNTEPHTAVQEKNYLAFAGEAHPSNVKVIYTRSRNLLGTIY